MRFTDRYFYFGSKPDSREPEDIDVHHVSEIWSQYMVGASAHQTVNGEMEMDLLVGRPLSRVRQGEKTPSMHVVLVVMPVDKMTNKFVSMNIPGTCIAVYVVQD